MAVFLREPTVALHACRQTFEINFYSFKGESHENVTVREIMFLEASFGLYQGASAVFLLLVYKYDFLNRGLSM
jgi:hypothetical protein